MRTPPDRPQAPSWDNPPTARWAQVVGFRHSGCFCVHG